MKPILLFISSTLIATAMNLNLSIKNIQNTQGKLFIGLYQTAEEFPKEDKFFKGESIPIDAKNISYTFENLPQGVYALALFHDENNNGKLDTNFVGMPTEGYGVSHNIRHLFSSPSFEEAKFHFTQETNMTIRVEY